MLKHTSTVQTKADMDFENELWNAANELRGAVAENQSKDYVLSLLFLKHFPERFEVRKQELQLSFADPESDYYNIEAHQQTEVLEEELEYQVKNVYRLPREATWAYLRENAEQDDIKVKVDQAFVLIDELLAKRNPDYKSVLEPIFVKSQLSPTQVAGLINLFSKEKFSEINNPESDIYHSCCNKIGSYADTIGLCKAAILAEVASNNYVLSPVRYMGSEAEEVDGVPFEEKIKGLTTELAAQFEESALLEKWIRENLVGIGFGY